MDEADAVGQVFEAQAGGDVVDGEVVLAQGEDALAGAGGGVGGGAGGSGPAGGEQEIGIVGTEELGAEIAEAAGGVAEAAGGLGRGAAVDEAGAEGLVAALAWGGRLEEAVSRSRHLLHEPMNIIKQYHHETFTSSRELCLEEEAGRCRPFGGQKQAAKVGDRASYGEIRVGPRRAGGVREWVPRPQVDIDRSVDNCSCIHACTDILAPQSDVVFSNCVV